MRICLLVHVEVVSFEMHFTNPCKIVKILWEKTHSLQFENNWRMPLFTLMPVLGFYAKICPIGFNLIYPGTNWVIHFIIYVPVKICLHGRRCFNQKVYDHHHKAKFETTRMLTNSSESCYPISRIQAKGTLESGWTQIWRGPECESIEFTNISQAVRCTTYKVLNVLLSIIKDNTND